MMKARRFLNVVIDKCDGGSLSRIVNPGKHLFYPSTAHAQQHQIQQQQKANAMAMAEKKVTSESTEEENYNGVLKLPTPKLRFNTSPGLGGDITTFHFLPFYSGTGSGRGEERILGVDGNGKAVLCDADTGIIEIMPSLDKPKGWDPVSLCVTHSTDATADPTNPDTAHDPDHPDALYVMDREGRSFEALVYGDPNPPPPCEYMDFIDRNRWVWHWRPLSPPPIVVDGRGGGSISVESYALLNSNGNHENASNSSSTICISFNSDSCREWSGQKSAPTGGTYCFDTGTGKWTKAGDWMLPFWYRALHVPELGEGLLFGFQKTGLSVQSRRFCAVDVTGAMRMDGSSPVLRHAWVDVDPPPRWDLQHYSVVYLGEGRFCIHRSFDIMVTDGWGSGEESIDTVVLLTGVEVVQEGSGLRMIKHKSIRLNTCIDSIL